MQFLLDWVIGLVVFDADCLYETDGLFLDDILSYRVSLLITIQVNIDLDAYVLKSSRVMSLQSDA